MSFESGDYFPVDDLLSLTSTLVGPLRDSFRERIARVGQIEIDGVRVCRGRQLERVFRGSVFYELVMGVLNERVIPSRVSEAKD